MMRCSRHLGGRDAAGAIESRKHFGQTDHFSPDRSIFFHNRYLKALISKIQGRLQSGNSAADNKRIKF